MKEYANPAVIITLVLCFTNLITFLYTAIVYLKYRPQYKKKYPQRVWISAEEVNALSYSAWFEEREIQVPLLSRGDFVDIASIVFLLNLIFVITFALIAPLTLNGSPNGLLSIICICFSISIWLEIGFAVTTIVRRLLTRSSNAIWPVVILSNYPPFIDTHLTEMDLKLIKQFGLRSGSSPQLGWIKALTYTLPCFALAGLVVLYPLSIFLQQLSA